MHAGGGLVCVISAEKLASLGDSDKRFEKTALRTEGKARPIPRRHGRWLSVSCVRSKYSSSWRTEVES